jgi:xylan 1,4-beta-xylosidase
VKPPHDDFDAPQLDPSWSSLRGPVEESWLSLTARPGWLRLRGRESLHSLFYQSLVAQRLTEHHCTARTCLEFRPEHFTQSAGLVCYYDTRTHFYLRVTHDEARGRILGVVLTDDGVYSELADSALVVNDWPAFHLQAEIDGARLQFAASRDGVAWWPVGPALDASKLSDDYGAALHFTGAFAGLCAQDLGGNGVIAAFADFTLTCLPVEMAEKHKLLTSENKAGLQPAQVKP